MEIKTFAKDKTKEKKVLVIGMGGSAFELPQLGATGTLSLEQVLASTNYSNDNTPIQQMDCQAAGHHQPEKRHVDPLKFSGRE